MSTASDPEAGRPEVEAEPTEAAFEVASGDSAASSEGATVRTAELAIESARESANDHAPEHAADLQRELALPSIIIDPALQSEPPPPDLAPPNDDSTFDIAAADRFASAIRPSWEPPAPSAAEAARVSSQRPVSARPSPRPEMPLPAAVSVEEPIEPLHVKEAQRRSLIWVGASVAGFLVLAYLGVSSSSKLPEHVEKVKASQERQAEANGAQAAASPKPPAAAVPPADIAPPPSVVAAHVIITTEPPNAELTLDRQAVANPLDAQMSVGDRHQLEAHAEGYVSAGRELHVTGDERIALVLTREQPAPAPEPTPAPEPVKAAPPPAAVPTPAATRKPTKTRTKAAAVATQSSKPTRVSSRRRAPAPAPAPKPAARLPKPKTKKGAGFVADSPY